MEETINIRLIFGNEHIGFDIFKQFEQLSLVQFETIRYRIHKTTKCSDYTEVKFANKLIKLIQTNSEFMFEAYKMPYYYSIMRKEKNCIFDISFDSDIFSKKKDDIFLMVDNMFVENIGIIGYICQGDDVFLQNTKDIENFKMKNKSYEHLKLIPSPFFSNDIVIDTEQNPGHSHIVKDLWFGSCWAMWFGKQYYDYIPQVAIASFKDGYENVQLKNDAHRVLLYEDVFSYDNPENRKIQQKFREVTGMDVVAHDLMNKSSENVDPTIEIINGNFEHGGTKMMKRYLDIDNEMIKKSKAVKVELREFVVVDNRWKTVSNEIVDI